jgi:hypothetical protein
MAPYFFGSAFAIAWFVIAGAAITIGLPLTAILVKLRWESAWIYPLAGWVTGTAIGLIFSSNPYSTPYIGILLLCGLPGAYCGWIWWRFVRRHRAVSRTRR